MSTISSKILKTPFTILIDSMEKHPFTFDGITSDASQGYRPIVVSHRWQALGVGNGDYSIENHQPIADRNECLLAPRVSIERKSIEDLIGTILGFNERRPRFERELETLASLESACVIVEGTLVAIINEVISQPQRGRKSPQENAKSLYRSIIAYQQDYRVPWIFCDDRRLAETTCFRWLERFWRKQPRFSEKFK